MKFKRSFVTPFLTSVFAATALSGVLMFFHILDGYTEVVHEILGMFFVIFSVFHVMVNWKAMKSFFGRKMFTLSVIIVLLLSAGLVVVERYNPPAHILIAEKLIKAPIKDTLKVLGADYSEVIRKFKANGIKPGDSKTIEDICKSNKISPGEMLDIIGE